jgi:hypothetical protein
MASQTQTRNGQSSPEVLPADDGGSISQLAMLPRDMALMKMENDTIQAMALARPRDYEVVKADIERQLKAFPSFAREAIYRKPVGKDEHGQQKFARGLSVRAAEAVAEAYGFNRVRTSVDEIPGDDSMVRVTATFTDFQRGRIWEDSGMLSKYYKARNGSRTKTPDDRFYGVVAKAEVSRRAREVILRSVPPGLRSELFEIAERAMANLMTDEQVTKILGAFAKINVTQEEIEKYLGAEREEWNQDHRVTLLEIWNAIKDGETTADEVFRAEPKKPAEGDAPKEASVDDLFNDAPQGDAPAAESSDAADAPYQKPGRDYLGSYALKLGCPENELNAWLDKALTLDKPEVWISDKPWERDEPPQQPASKSKGKSSQKSAFDTNEGTGQ